MQSIGCAARAYAEACIAAIRETADAVAALDWAPVDTPQLGAVVEAFCAASGAASRFLPSVPLNDRERRAAYTGWWIVRAWECSAPPEPMLRLLLVAFDGAGPAVNTLFERVSHANIGSLAIGLLTYFGESEDYDIADLRRTLRELAWPRVPKKLRDEMDRETLYRHLDIAAWEVIKQRMAQVTPLEALVRGLDGELWNSPV